MKQWVGYRNAIIIVASLAVCLWIVWGSTPPAPTSNSHSATQPGGPGTQTTPERSPDAPAEGPSVRVSADPRLDPKGDRSTERISRAREESGFGTLTDRELANLVDLLVVLEKSSADNRYGYIASGGLLNTYEYADLTYDVEGAQAKASALLEGSYVLLPPGRTVDAAILRDSNLHVVVGPGGEREGKPFQTHIIVDLRKHGRFAEAMKDWIRLRNEKDKAKEK